MCPLGGINPLLYRLKVLKMYRYFESLVNPYANRGNMPPARDLWTLIREEMGPFRRLIPGLLISAFVVAVFETWLISYSGQVIDYVNQSEKDTLWATYGVELVLVALLVLGVRPFLFYATGLYQHQALSGSLRDQVRWRSHIHMLGQSRGFFQDDFAGRLANRVMQVGPAVEDNVFTFFEAVWFVSIYFISALWIMTGRAPAMSG